MVAFKNLKRRYSETVCMLQAADAKIKMKKARLDAIDCTRDAGAAKVNVSMNDVDIGTNLITLFLRACSE